MDHETFHHHTDSVTPFLIPVFHVRSHLASRSQPFEQGISFVTQLIREGKTPEDVLARIFSGIPYHLLGKQDLFFRCTCSKERIERALIALGSDELQGLIAEQEETDVTCEYCLTNYRFSREELEDLRRGITLS